MPTTASTDDEDNKNQRIDDIVNSDVDTDPEDDLDDNELVELKCPCCRRDLFEYTLDQNNQYKRVDNFKSFNIMDDIKEVVNKNLNNCNDVINKKEAKIIQLEEQIIETKRQVKSPWRLRIKFFVKMKMYPSVVTFGTINLGACNLTWNTFGLQFSYFPKDKAQRFYFPIKLIEEIVCCTFRKSATIIIFPKKTNQVPNNAIIKRFYQGNSERYQGNSDILCPKTIYTKEIDVKSI